MKSIKVALPGLGIFAMLWVITLLRGDASEYMTREIESMWQSARIGLLSSDPLGTLRVLHTQPPGMNALFAIDAQVSAQSHWFLLGLYCIATMLTIVLLVDALRRVGVAPSWAAAAGVVLALLPSTVIYSQWAYSVAIVSCLAMACVWGIAAIRESLAVGVAVSALSAAGLVLIRPSFTWLFLVGWVVGLTVVVWRNNERRRLLAVTPMLVAVIAVGAVQLHYLTSFGLPFMSSWSGENVAKALAVSNSLSVTPEARDRIDEDVCLSDLLAAYEQDNVNRWDWQAFRGLPGCSTVPGLPDRSAEAWNVPIKPGTEEGNFIFSERLVTSRYWSQMMSVIIREDPWQLVRMAVTTEYGPRNSGVGLYLGPSEDYFFVRPIRDAQPLAVPLGLVSVVFAPALLVLVVAGLVLTAFPRGRDLRRIPAFWFGAGLIAYHALVNTLLEYSENMRYRAEIDPVLLFTGVLVLFLIVSPRRSGDRVAP